MQAVPLRSSQIKQRSRTEVRHAQLPDIYAEYDHRDNAAVRLDPEIDEMSPDEDERLAEEVLHSMYSSS